MEPKEETQKFDLRKLLLQALTDVLHFDKYDRLTPNELTDHLCAEIEAHQAKEIELKTDGFKTLLRFEAHQRNGLKDDIDALESKLALAKMVIGKLRQWDRYHEELEAWDAKQKEKE